MNAHAHTLYTAGMIAFGCDTVLATVRLQQDPSLRNVKLMSNSTECTEFPPLTAHVVTEMVKAGAVYGAAQRKATMDRVEAALSGSAEIGFIHRCAG